MLGRPSVEYGHGTYSYRVRLAAEAAQAAGSGLAARAPQAAKGESPNASWRSTAGTSNSTETAFVLVAGGVSTSDDAIVTRIEQALKSGLQILNDAKTNDWQLHLRHATQPLFMMGLLGLQVDQYPDARALMDILLSARWGGAWGEMSPDVSHSIFQTGMALSGLIGLNADKKVVEQATSTLERARKPEGYWQAEDRHEQVRKKTGVATDPELLTRFRLVDTAWAMMGLTNTGVDLGTSIDYMTRNADSWRIPNNERGVMVPDTRVPAHSWRHVLYALAPTALVTAGFEPSDSLIRNNLQFCIDLWDPDVPGWMEESAREGRFSIRGSFWTVFFAESVRAAFSRKDPLLLAKAARSGDPRSFGGILHSDANIMSFPALAALRGGPATIKVSETEKAIIRLLMEHWNRGVKASSLRQSMTIEAKERGEKLSVRTDEGIKSAIKRLNDDYGELVGKVSAGPNHIPPDMSGRLIVVPSAGRGYVLRFPIDVEPKS